jgi:glucose/arabinose dehydrogenase
MTTINGSKLGSGTAVVAVKFPSSSCWPVTRLYQRHGDHVAQPRHFRRQGRRQDGRALGMGKRICDVAEAPDGSLWLLEDANPGAP